MTRPTVRAHDVPIEDGRTLRVAVLERDGEPEALIFAVGTGQGASWREDPAEGLSVPATALSGLLEALGALAG